MIKGISLEPAPPGPKADPSQMRLESTCAEFESILLTHMLKTMRKTIFEGGLLGKSEERRIFDSMLDESLGLSISRSGGIGIAKMLFERLKG